MIKLKIFMLIYPFINYKKTKLNSKILEFKVKCIKVYRDNF